METIKYSLISKQDLKLGTGTFEITLADGRIVTVDEVDIGKLLEKYPIKSYATTSDLPTTDVSAGSIARVTADGGLYIYSGSAWAAVGGSGSHNHAASEITSGTLAMARGGLGADFSATAQGYIFYFSSTGVLAALAPGAVGQFLQTQGASANPLWADPESLTAHTIGSTTHTDITLTSVAQGDILYRNGSSTWVNLAPGTSGQFLKTQGASANPTWADVTTGFILDKVTANTTVSGTTAETTLYSKSVAGGTLSTSNSLRLTVRITDLDLADAESVILRFKYGGTTLASVTITNSTGGTVSNVQLRLTGTVNADGATNAQLGDLWVASTGSTLTMAPDYGAGTAAIDSTSAQTLLLSSDFSSASATDSITIGYAILETLS